MFEIRHDPPGRVVLTGRFDAARASEAQAVLDSLGSSCVVDFSRLEYISSAGLGVLLRTQKRLMQTRDGLRLVNVNHHIHDILRYSGFDQIFEIDRALDV